LIGLGFFFTHWLYKRSKNNTSLLTILLLPVGAFIVILGDILQKTPWKSFLYEPSISYRGDYWRSGWNMLLANPIFGVGPDGFKDNYRLFRDSKSLQRGVSGNVDSSHNIFLDIGTSGGFPLLFLFIGIHLLILASIYRIIFRYKVEDVSIIGVISCWIAFEAQSIISVPRISLSILGWILGGLIIGYDLNRVRTQQTRQVPIKTKFTVIGLVLGMVIAFPSFINDVRFRTALTNGEVRVIKQTLNQWPQSYEHFIFFLISESSI
jgi:O-antigen ligase